MSPFWEGFYVMKIIKDDIEMRKIGKLDLYLTSTVNENTFRLKSNRTKNEPNGNRKQSKYNSVKGMCLVVVHFGELIERYFSISISICTLSHAVCV